MLVIVSLLVLTLIALYGNTKIHTEISTEIISRGSAGDHMKFTGLTKYLLSGKMNCMPFCLFLGEFVIMAF